MDEEHPERNAAAFEVISMVLVGSAAVMGAAIAVFFGVPPPVAFVLLFMTCAALLAWKASSYAGP